MPPCPLVVIVVAMIVMIVSQMNHYCSMTNGENGGARGAIVVVAVFLFRVVKYRKNRHRLSVIDWKSQKLGLCYYSARANENENYTCVSGKIFHSGCFVPEC